MLQKIFKNNNYFTVSEMYVRGFVRESGEFPIGVQGQIPVGGLGDTSPETW